MFVDRWGWVQGLYGGFSEGRVVRSHNYGMTYCERMGTDNTLNVLQLFLHQDTIYCNANCSPLPPLGPPQAPGTIQWLQRHWRPRLRTPSLRLCIAPCHPALVLRRLKEPELAGAEPP